MEMESSIKGETLRTIMRQVPSPVTVVTASGAEEVRGITIGSLTSVSLDPPLVSFNVHQEARMHEVITSTERFVVHVVTEEQIHLCQHFAEPDLTGVEQFEALRFRRDDHGTPVLEDVLAVLFCEVHTRFGAGDHTIVVGRVVEVEEYEGEPVIYHQRTYRGVGDVVQSNVLAPVNRSSSDTSLTPAPKKAKS